MSKYTPKTFQELKWLVDDESVYLGDIDTSLITDMSFLFSYSNRKDFSGIEKWDVSNVECFLSMFYACKTFNEPLEGWNVSSAIEMGAMFFGCKNFNQSLNNWDIRNVEDMDSMFIGCDSLNTSFENWPKIQNVSILAFSGLNTKLLGLKINKVNGKFQPKNKYELNLLVSDESVYLGDIDTSLITDMSKMFIEVSRKDFCGIESWDVSKVINMYAMFSRQKDFYADLSSWDVSKVENVESMFYGCKKFNGQIPKGWDLKADSSNAFLSFRSMLKKYKN